MSKKVTDQGWFYHAPVKREQKERVAAPPPSQIPGLSDTSHLPPENPNVRTMLRESDSKYIRLAKQGGRPDLLRTRTPEPRSEEPVGYPRCEWFYDNIPQDANDNKEPYQFLLPDYMVHMPIRTKPTNDSAAERTPYAYDTKTVYDRDGCQATDKTVKLTEDRPSGYGVRCERQQQKQAKKSREADASRAPPTNGSAKPIRKEPEVPIQMKKLLSFGYVDDYEAQKSSWEERETAKNAANETCTCHASSPAKRQSTRISGGKQAGAGTKKTAAACRT